MLIVKITINKLRILHYNNRIGSMASNRVNKFTGVFEQTIIINEACLCRHLYNYDYNIDCQYQYPNSKPQPNTMPNETIYYVSGFKEMTFL